MKRKTILKHGQRVALAACCWLIGAGVMQSCQDDDTVLTGQPSWLGNSIYERLQEDGNYPEMLRLIDDMGLHDMMSRTGSKTLFVADHDAFNEWFATNSWGVRRYEDLTTAQKSLLLNNAMIDNAFLIELLSSLPAQDNEPIQTGSQMRRKTATSSYDSIATMRPENMPTTKAWDYVRGRSQGIRIMMDGSDAPMIHFLPAFMRTNKITDHDLEILTNGVSNTINDAWVNGMRVVESDITCKNGYIQKMSGVIQAAPNMAQILQQHENMSMWSHLINRFSAPYYVGSNLSLGIDSLFELRYFADLGANGRNAWTPSEPTLGLEAEAVEATLTFDPGWNQYSNSGSTTSRGYRNDAAMMLVPSNTALSYWWEHDGKVLQEKYKEWDSIPDLVISKLLNVNMKTSFVESVPSKFESVLDDAKMEMGITEEHIDSCFMGCNGVVYLTNRVFSPRAYSSVSFPALIHQDLMSIIYWAIDDETLSFGPYLNSMDSYYSLFLPTNNALLTYIDPASYGESRQIVYRFFYDPTRDKNSRVGADRYYIVKDPETGEYPIDPVTGDLVFETGSHIGEASMALVRNRLEDMLNTLIVVGNVESGYEYYKTKGGGMIHVANAGQENVMTASAGYQLETGKPLTVSTIYDQSQTGNGKSYLLEKGTLMGASKSVYETLSAHPEMKVFLDLLNGNDEDSTKYNLLISRSGNYNCTNSTENKNMRLFEKYNYTVYVPTNEAIQKLIDDKYLPTWEDYDAQTEEVWGGNEALQRKARAAIRNRIVSFLRYHIQDNAVYIGAEPTEPTLYETAKLNPENQRFFSLLVDVNGRDMTIGYGPNDQAKQANKRSVITSGGLYNLMCREYWLSGSGTGRSIVSSSDAVLHQIDGVLLYDNSLTSKTWEQELHELRTQNQ